MNLAQIADPETLISSEEKIRTPEAYGKNFLFDQKNKQESQPKSFNIKTSNSKNLSNYKRSRYNQRQSNKKKDNLKEKWGERSHLNHTNRHLNARKKTVLRKNENSLTNVSHENNSGYEDSGGMYGYSRKDSREDSSAYHIAKNKQISFRSLVKSQNAIKFQNSEYEDFLREIKEVSSAEEESRIIKEGEPKRKTSKGIEIKDYETKKNKIKKKRGEVMKVSEEELVNFDTAKFSGFSSFEFNSKLTLESPNVNYFLISK